MNDQPTRILLIEDNPGDARLVREALREAGAARFDLTTVTHLAGGLAHLASQPVDAILLDLTLPDSSGFDTFYTLHAKAAQIPIILLTGMQDEQLAVRAVQAGAQDYLVKGGGNAEVLVRSIQYAIQRKQAERNLAQSQARYQMLFENSGNGVVIVDEHGQFLLANKVAAAMFGKEPQEVVGKCMADFLPQAQAARYLEFNRELLRAGGIREYEETFRLPTGEHSFLIIDQCLQDENGRNYAIQSSSINISGRRQAEAALRESEDKFKYVFEYSSVGKSITSVSGGFHPNKAFCEMLGYSLEELQNKKWQEITHPDDIALTKKEIDSLLSGEKEQVRFSKRYLHQQGGIVWVDLSSSLRRDAQGQPLYLMTTLVDISERKHMEQAILLLSDTQQQLTHLESIPEIYQVVGSKIQELTGEDGYVVITSLDEELQAIRVAGLFGFGNIYKNLARRFKLDPARSAYPLTDMTEEELLKFRSGKLEAFEGGVYALLTRKVPRAICAVAEKQMKFTGIYTMGFTWQGIHYGGLVLLAKREIAPYQDMIETIMNQATLAIKRIRAEEALQTSEKRYKSLIESQSDLIARSDLDGRLTFVNDAYCSTFGKTREELIGRVFSPTVFPEDLPVTLAMLKTIQSPPYHMRTETRHPTPAGLRWFSWDNMAVLDEGGKIHELQGIGRDVTDRKRAEVALQVSEMRYQAVARLSSDFSFSCIHSGKAGYTVDWITDAFFKITGYSEADLREHGCWMFVVHPQDQAAATEPLRRLRHGQADTREFRILTKAGSTRWFTNTMECTSDPAAPGGLMLLGSVQDITGRRQAQTALLNSEKRFRALIENNTDAVVLVDRDSVIQYESPAYGRLTGRDPEERLGRNSSEFIHPDDKESITGLLKELSQAPGGIRNSTFRHQHKDGSWHWIEAAATNLLDEPAVQAIVVNMHDITERKRVTDALGESEQRFRVIFEKANDAIHIDNPSGEILSANPRLCEMTGYSLEELLKMHVSDLQAPELRRPGGVVPDEFAQYGPGIFERLNMHKDGRRIPVEISLGLIERPSGNLYVSVVRDITERKQSEEALRESEERYKLMFEFAPLAINITRGTDITYANPSYLKMFGFASLDELILRKPLELFTPEFRTTIRENIQRRAEGLPVPDFYEAECFRKDGSRFPVEMYFARTKFVDGLATVGFILDITERKQAEKAVRQQMDELQRWYDLTLDRETRSLELKQEVNALLRRLNEPERYSGEAK